MKDQQTLVSPCAEKKQISVNEQQALALLTRKRIE